MAIYTENNGQEFSCLYGDVNVYLNWKKFWITYVIILQARNSWTWVEWTSSEDEALPPLPKDSVFI